MSFASVERIRFVGVVAAAVQLLVPVAVAGQAEHSPVVQATAPVTPFVFDGDVRDLPPAPVWKPGDPIREIPRRFYPKPGAPIEPDYEPGIDPLLEIQQSAPVYRGSGSFSVPTRNFAGQGFSGVSPPDTVGDVGLDHYIQMINTGGGTDVRIWDKAEPNPNVITTFRLDSLGGGACASGFGDPVALYDRLADRWMLTEFSSAGNDLCVYISQTPDPVSGGWFAYSFVPPSFPDYPKYGVWPTDANGGQGSYIVTANDGGSNRGIYAMQRGQMLTGDPAGFQLVDIPGLPGFGFEAATPADLDGPTPPPTGAPAIIMRHRDTENHSGPAAPGDLLEMWTFDIDWVNQANSVLSTETSIDVAEFDSSLCGLSSFNCFPQPGSGVTLDPLREVIMFRLQYMNHDDHETLVGNFVTDVDGANLGGVRWFELRGGDGAWAVHQEGTYSIDADSRWMGAISMDQSGNIALAYNVSSTSTFPSLRYTGRLSDDPPGMMTQPETVIHAGTAASGSNRYGDYAAMNVDPADDCTFWFTGEDNTSSSWRTQVASFKFEACGCLLFPDPLSPLAIDNGDNQIDISWDDSELETIVEYEVRRSRTPGGPYETIAVVPDDSPGVGNGPGYFFEDLTVSGAITYYYVVRASDGSACKSAIDNETNATATGACTLAPVFDGLQSVSAPDLLVCTLDLAWPAAGPECGGPETYNIYRSTTPGFTPGPGTLLAAGVNNTVFSDLNSLVDGQPYYYIVRAVDLANGEEEQNLVELSGVPFSSGGLCTTGSACPENPFVNVEPDGPLTVCDDSGLELTANLTGGTEPFTFQWTRDGVPIPGADEQTFAPTDVGIFQYNCIVQAAACSDTVMDGLRTQIDTQEAPVFGGVEAILDPQNGSCTLDVQWSPAASVCPGPVEYFVYRDTNPAVATVPANLVASGLPGTSFNDAAGLLEATDYYYLVRALERSTFKFDTNTVVKAGAPTGPGTGLNFVLDEDFEDPASFADWTVSTGPGRHRCGEWERSGSSAQRPAGGSGSYALTLSQACTELLPQTSTILDSPVIDVDLVGIQSVTLEYDIYFNHFDGDADGTVEVWDGSAWQVLWTDTNSDLNAHQSFDVTAFAAGNSDFQVRFNYQDANDDRWFSVDNVQVIADILTSCAVGDFGPPPAPDGRSATAPLHGDRVTTAGDVIQTTWDATSCLAGDYNLLFGDLSGVGSTVITGSECSIGTAGSFTWSSVPAGDLFFLVVGTDGAGTESSWGVTSVYGERNGLGPSGECGTAAKDISESCP